MRQVSKTIVSHLMSVFFLLLKMHVLLGRQPFMLEQLNLPLFFGLFHWLIVLYFSWAELPYKVCP